MTEDVVFNRPEFLRRLTRRHHAGDWIGGLRRLCGPLTESEDDGMLETRPPQYLVALWRPVRPEMPFIERWPFKATLVQPDSTAAARDLLADVPESARLWLGTKHIDWAFVAEIVMLGERHLQAYHYRELQSFIRTERQATLAAISVHYSGDDEVFEQFSSTRPPLLE